MQLPRGARLFSLEEANALLPTLARLIEKMKGLYFAMMREVDDRGGGGDRLDLYLYENREDPVIGGFLKQIEALILEIEGLGCFFKGLDLGLVDFPALRAGEQILLCWQYGESEVGFYHGLEEGFAGRLPLAGQDIPVKPRLN